MRKYFLVLLVFGLFVGNIFALSGEIRCRILGLIIENKKKDLKIINEGDWLLRNEGIHYGTGFLANRTGKDISLNLKFQLVSVDKKDSIIIATKKDFKVSKRVKGFNFIIPNKIINQLKPKEYRLKVVMVEDGVEKVIGKRGDITIEGDHIEKIEKEIDDIEYKKSADFNKLEFDYKNNEEYQRYVINTSLDIDYGQNPTLPFINLVKIKNKNEIISFPRTNLSFPSKKYQSFIFNKNIGGNRILIFTFHRKSYYYAQKSGRKRKKININSKFTPNKVIIGLTRNKKLNKLDKILTTIDNFELKPGETKTIKCNLDLDKLKKDFYKIVIKMTTRPIILKYGKKHKLSIMNVNQVKKYSVDLEYTLKDKE